MKGLHSWIQLHREERAGRLDYRGCRRPRARAADGRRLEEEQVAGGGGEGEGTEEGDGRVCARAG